MKFIYEPDLQEYMKQKGKHNVIVEVVSSENSDFEVTELHVYLVNDKRATFFKEHKKFKSMKTEIGEVLLPPYKLEYDDTITFGLKSFWIFKSLEYTGIKL